MSTYHVISSTITTTISDRNTPFLRLTPSSPPTSPTEKYHNNFSNLDHSIINNNNKTVLTKNNDTTDNATKSLLTTSTGGGGFSSDPSYFYNSPNSSTHSLTDQDEEDLDENIFYTTIRKDYPKILDRVTVVCVPHSKSIVGMRINRNFIETHSLKPSPYFQGQFQSINKKVVSIERNWIKLISERPLEGEGRKSISTDDDYQMFNIPIERNHETDLIFLRSILDNDNPIKDLENMIEEFNETYVYVKGYSGFAVDRIAQILQRAVQGILQSNSMLSVVCRTQHEYDHFLELVENILMSELHNKIFIQSLLPIYHSHDSYLESIINIYSRAQISLKDYGVCERLQDMPVEMLNAACEILKNLDEDDDTSIGIRDNDALKYAGLGITTHSNNTEGGGTIQEIATISDTYLQLAAPKLTHEENERSSITTDDFIPLLAYVIINSKIRKLASILFYMQTFRLSKVERSELSFALTTLRASTEFLKLDPLQLHDTISTTSSISSISSHSSHKFSPPILPNNSKVRSRATSLSSPSTSNSSASSVYPSSQYNYLKCFSTPGLVQHPPKRDKSPARSLNSGPTTSPRMSNSPVIYGGYNKHQNNVDELMTVSSGRSKKQSDFDNHNPAPRRRRPSITPGLVIKPQILLSSTNRNEGNNGNNVNSISITDSPLTLLPLKPMTSATIPAVCDISDVVGIMSGINERNNDYESNNNENNSINESKDKIGKLAPLTTKKSSSRMTSRSNPVSPKYPKNSGDLTGGFNVNNNNNGRKPNNWRHSIHAPEILAVIPRHTSNGITHTGKPILDLSPPNAEILGDFLSSLQNIDGEVAGNRNGGLTARKW
ncbi:2615_t:CDS:2 [Diversispora eburnea]|uniref:2615_t:CDS:1 n=1 Tax=Diversispora eburnea TaxID=1213867 RepID=A0A9N9BZ30_9GLOM|nr:2615_t:CDS:2 [Diversispora eburnea]